VASPKPGRQFITTEIEEDLARRFREACRAEDRSVSGGLRRLVRHYLGEIDDETERHLKRYRAVHKKDAGNGHDNLATGTAS
jgi:Ribbon-helix-helix protein, copG family